MHTTNLRKVGGSIMLALPPALLDQLNLKVGSSVSVAVADGELVIKPSRPKYRLDDLLAASYYVPPSEEDEAWEGMPSVGRDTI